VLRVRVVVGGVALALALVAPTACSGGSGAGAGGAPPAAVPAALQRFLDRVAKAGSVPFTAKYQVLQKLGGAVTEVTVEAAPPSWRITTGDVVIIGGPTEATCHVSTTTCKRGIDESALGAAGVFSGLFAGAPIQQLRTAALRPGADAPTFSSQPTAGATLDCVVISTAPVTACLTPDGVFGLVDDSARRYGLTSYAATPPANPITPPYPVT
jgi:hypothetical protein